MAADLCTFHENQYSALVPGERYIITLDRDHDAKLNLQEREVLKTFFEISHNTDFSQIIAGELEDFQSNDLKSQEEQGEYKNTSPGWHKFYNATQVVAIWHRHVGDAHIFGFLAGDLLSTGNYPSIRSKGDKIDHDVRYRLTRPSFSSFGDVHRLHHGAAAGS
jgi:hypothetical protein